MQAMYCSVLENALMCGENEWIDAENDAGDVCD